MEFCCFHKQGKFPPMEHKFKNPIFVIQKHRASHLHYDFRLEKDGVLKSWAVPKEPPQEVGIKRLAIQVEDHSMNFANFAGEIPKGEYGAGLVEVWDKGYYIPIKFEHREIIFELKGRKMEGTYCLLKLKPKVSQDKNWLFFKKKNKQPIPDFDDSLRI